MIEILKAAPAPFLGTEVHRFDNGLRVILKEDHTSPVVSLQIWVRCGAVDETARIFGISHGLEHMVFKGTPTRNVGEISTSIEAQGGYINAATALETTHFYIDVPSYGWRTAIDVLADALLHPTFPNDEWEKERRVIMEEIRSRDDSPDATLWDEFSSKIFQDSPYGTKVIGDEKTVASITQQDLFNHFNHYYMPENKCVVAVGDFETKEMLERLTSLFKEEQKRPAPTPPAINITTNPATIFEIKKPVHLVHFALGLPTVELGHPDAIAIDVLADILGGGLSSRIYHSLREEKQLVLSLSCDYTSFKQKGLFSFYGECLPEKAEKALSELREEIVQVKSTPITEAELDRAKARIKSEWLHNSESPRGQATSLGYLGVLDALDIISTYLDSLKNLNQATVMAAYHKYIDAKPLILTKILPQHP